MRVWGSILCWIALVAAGLFSPSAGASAHASVSRSCSPVEMTLDGRSRGTVGMPWSPGMAPETCKASSRELNVVSMHGWYRGLKDYCTPRGVLMNVIKGRHGIELCLFQDSRASIGETDEGMNMLGEVLSAVSLVKGMSPGEAKKEYAKDLPSTCKVGFEDVNTPDDPNCVKGALYAAAKKKAQSAEYQALYEEYEIANNYVVAENNLQRAINEVAASQALRQQNQAELAAVIRERNNTTRPVKLAALNARIKALESYADALTVSYANAVEDEEDMRLLYEEAKDAYEARMAELAMN